MLSLQTALSLRTVFERIENNTNSLDQFSFISVWFLILRWLHLPLGRAPRERLLKLNSTVNR